MFCGIIVNMEKLNLMDTQLLIENVKISPTVCAFTGHRILEADFSARKLKKEIISLVEKGVTEFLCGMAIGFDLICAETVISLKKKWDKIKLIACIPCENQERNYFEADKKRYVKILKKADEKIYLAKDYYKGCMLTRDRFMADKADVMIAYCKKDTGGTAYTVRYFKKKYPLKEIIFL